jgi:flavin reductase (DIM6/NTAB) family NADH-FMN oxidoreductase RutF
MNPSSAAASSAASQASEAIQAGDPVLDPRAFRRCLGQFATGVTLVTARNGERLAGMAVNSFAAVSLAPALVLWSIRRESGSVADFVQAGHYAVSVLSDEQVELSQLFGSAHPERFERAPWHASRHGDPLIEGALAHFECRLEQVIEAGDHLILLGQVEHYARYEGSPLLFSQGAYGISQELPAPSTGQPAAGAPHAASSSDPELLRELIHASQRLSHDFDAHRQALGLTIPTARLLNILSDGASCVDELAASSFLEQDEIADGLAVLEQFGLVSSDGGRLELTAAGCERRAAIAGRAASYMSQRLEGQSAADIAAFRRVLKVLRQD